LILQKGSHQTGHNSGVIHAGIYYTPGSLKARLCTRGSKLMYQYLDEKNIRYLKCGKLIVAIKKDEIPRLYNLFEKGIQNGVKNLELLEQSSISKVEPKCKGIKAIWSPETGIVNYRQVNLSFGFDFEQNGGKIYFNFKVDDLKIKHDHNQRLIELVDNQNNQKLKAKFVVSAAGLFSDKLAQMTGGNSVPKIVPFRGEYLVIKKPKGSFVKVNIYPVPDPRLPFLGIHITPRIDGSIWIGPNAILAFKREGYQYSDIDLNDILELLSYKGLRNLMMKYFKSGLKEIYHSLNVSATVGQIQYYVDDLSIQDVEVGPSGVRAQALDEEGNLIEDFIFDSGSDAFHNQVLHIRNAPSPAATSSLAIAEVIVDKIEKQFSMFSSKCVGVG